MAALQQPFNPASVDPQAAMSQLPVGQHLVVAIASAIEATKDKTGGLVKFTLSIADGSLRGMQGDYRLNLYNASQKAVEIAQKQLSALCHACGVNNLQDTSQLHNIPFVVVVTPQEDPKYTQISGVKYADGSDIRAGQFGSPGAPQQQQSAPPAQTAPAGAWGGQQQPQQQPAQQPQQQAPAVNGGAAWGGGQSAPASQPQQQQPAGAWQQNGQQPGGKPAWG